MASTSPPVRTAKGERTQKSVGSLPRRFASRTPAGSGCCCALPPPRREGIEAGRREGVADALLQLVAARALPLTVEQRARIENEQDVERLRDWLRRAAVATSMTDVF